MGAVKNILLGVLIISILTFVALFGQLPALRRTPIGWLQRALFTHLPNGLKRIDERATGGRITRRSRRLGQYLFYERNPVVLIIFLILLTGSATLFLTYTLHLLPPHLLLPVPLLLSPPYLFTYLCATHTSHFITPSTLSRHLREYPYDHILYHPSAAPCRTCLTPKPARSKHCSLCNHCIAKCDHHCPWVNACLGRGNYHYFLALLLSLGLLQVYGAYLAYRLLRPRADAYWNRNAFIKRSYWTEVADGILFALHSGGLPIAGVGLLAATTAAMPFGLLVYHCYLIWAGMTTNESQKWADWRDDMADGYVFKASRKALREYNQTRRKRAAQTGRSGNPALDVGIDDVHEDGQLGVQWPIESDQVIVKTNDGKPPVGQEGLWTRVRDIREVDNIYDMGGWRNFAEVLMGG